MFLHSHRYLGCFDETFGWLRFSRNSYYIHILPQSNFLLNFESDYAGYTFNISLRGSVGEDFDNLRFPSPSNPDS
jgi:hypothetical protein